MTDDGKLKIVLNDIINKEEGDLIHGLQLSSQFLSEDAKTYLNYTRLIKEYLNGDIYLLVSDQKIELVWWSYFLKEFPEYSKGFLGKGYSGYGLDVKDGTLDGLMKTIKQMIDIFRRIAESPAFLADVNEYVENYDRYTEEVV